MMKGQMQVMPVVPVVPVPSGAVLTRRLFDRHYRRSIRKRSNREETMQSCSNSAISTFFPFFFTRHKVGAEQPTFLLLMMVLTLLGSSAVLSTATVTAAPTTMTNGEWIGCYSFRTIQADIGGRSETVALPKMEFGETVDIEELNEKIRAGIKRQAAVFHLYHDGLGSPKRVGMMLFASDVYLKELKMTYSGFLRQLGYSAAVAAQAPFEDPSYLRDVQADRYVAMDRRQKNSTDGSGTAKDQDDQEQKKKKQRAQKEEEAQATSTVPRAGSSNIRTTWDVMPVGVLPPEVRKMQAEIEARVRKVKERPFQKEIIRVDAVRWATGVMGIPDNDGFIRESRLEGQRPVLWLFPPKEKDWLTPQRIKQLQGQPCEFILQRNTQGLERRYRDAYHLADVYLTDLGLTWEDWLQDEGLTFVPQEQQNDWATAPVVMSTQVCHASTLQLMARSLVKVRLHQAIAQQQEVLVRIQPPPLRIRSFPEFAAKVQALIENQPLSLILMLCPDGQTYREMKQLRAVRIYFPKLEATLNMLLERCQDPPPRRR